MTESRKRPAGEPAMRAVLFDVGGTLVHIDHARIAAIIERVLGIKVLAQAVADSEYAGRAAVEAALGDTQGSDGERWAVHFRGMLESLGIGPADFARVGPAILASHKERHLWCVVPPGTTEALDALAHAGWYVGCVSNADGKVAELLESHGLRHRLRCIIDSGAVGIEKPDPRIFALALEQSGIPARETYYVGDVHGIDVIGAARAGLVPVLLDPLGRYADRGCRTTPDVATFSRELVSLRDAA